MNRSHKSTIASGRIALCLATALLVVTTAFAETAVPVFPPDTEVRLATTEPLSSASATLGQKIALTVVEDVMLDEQVVIPKGSPGVGTVIFAHKKALGGFPGALDLRPDFLSLGAQKINLRSHASSRGKSRSSLAANLAPMGVGLFIVGSDVDLQVGSELLAYVAAGSADPDVATSSHAWIPPPIERKGLVIFFRANDKSNPFLAHQKIKIDDEVVGTMVNDHYFHVYVDPGEHRVESASNLVRLLKIDAGETAYIQGRLVQGIWLSDTDPDVAQDLIARLKHDDAP